MPAVEEFPHHSAILHGPAENAFPITPHATEELAFVTRAINVAETGSVQLETKGGQVVTVYVAAGVAFPIRAKRVLVSETTATGIVGLY
jgi:hypothetical protein